MRLSRSSEDGPLSNDLAKRVVAMSKPELMRFLRSLSSQLADDVVFVPLFGVPYHDAGVQELVTSVLCHATAACSAFYSSDPARLAAQVPGLFLSMDVPAVPP